MLDQGVLAALNHLLLGAAWARARLAPFAGRTARLSLPPFRLDFVITAEGILIAPDSAGSGYDVEISFPIDTPLLALRGSEAVAKATHISGSAEFADALGFLLRNLRWDFEEDLSKGVGDIAAHRVARLLKAIDAWQQQAIENLAENVAEYLTEERQILVNQGELGAFSTASNQLHGDLVQLERRVLGLGI